MDLMVAYASLTTRHLQIDECCVCCINIITEVIYTKRRSGIGGKRRNDQSISFFFLGGGGESLKLFVDNTGSNYFHLNTHPRFK